MNEIKKLRGGVDPTTRMLKSQLMDNTNLERDQKIFLRRQKEGHNM